MLTSKRILNLLRIVAAKGKRAAGNSATAQGCIASGLLEHRLEEKGELTSEGARLIGMHFVPCTGAAHSNPHIDNCMCCAPRWGQVLVPVEYPTMDAYRMREEATEITLHP